MTTKALVKTDFTNFAPSKRPTPEEQDTLRAAQAILATIPAEEIAPVATLEEEYVELLKIKPITVNSDDSFRTAGESVVALKEGHARIKKWFDSFVKRFATPHKLATSHRKNILDPLERIWRGMESGMNIHQRNKEAEAQRLVQKAEEEARQLALKAEEEARRVEEQAKEDQAPWETDESVQQAAQEAQEKALRIAEEAQEKARRLAATPVTAPTVEGMHKRSTPWKYRVLDFKALVKWAVEQGKEEEYLLPNDKVLTVKARQLGVVLKEVVPGIEAYKDTGFARG